MYLCLRYKDESETLIISFKKSQEFYDCNSLLLALRDKHYLIFVFILPSIFIIGFLHKCKWLHFGVCTIK